MFSRIRTKYYDLIIELCMMPRLSSVGHHISSQAVTVLVIYHARALSSPRAEFGTPNFEFESCRTITENSARMDRATTKQEGEKRNYKIRMCKLTM